MMIKPQVSKKIPSKLKDIPKLKAIFCSVLIRVTYLILAILLIVSGLVIIIQYSLIVLEYTPNTIQKMKLDYSITIFTGSAIFLLIYRHKFKEIVDSILDVKDVELIDNSD